MTFFINPLDKISSKFINDYSLLLKAFDSGWEDEVKDSYLSYIKLVKEYSDCLQLISKTLNSKIDYLNCYKIDEAIRDGNELHKAIKEFLSNESKSE